MRGLNRPFVRKFFKTRFKRNPEDDPHYYKEWEGRFATGTPEVYMDAESKKVHHKLLKMGGY